MGCAGRHLWCACHSRKLAGLRQQGIRLVTERRPSRWARGVRECTPLLPFSPSAGRTWDVSTQMTSPQSTYLLHPQRRHCPVIMILRPLHSGACPRMITGLQRAQFFVRRGSSGPTGVHALLVYQIINCTIQTRALTESPATSRGSSGLRGGS